MQGQSQDNHNTNRWFLAFRWAIGLISVTLLLWICAAGAVGIYGELNDHGPAKAAIVLGAAAYPRGPSPVFEARLKHAADLYHQGLVEYIVVTGGFGRGAKISEGETGFRYLQSHDVSAQAILYENCSVNTRENLAEAANLLSKLEGSRLLLVSDPLHLARSVYIARQLGLDAHGSATPHTRFRTIKTQVPFAFNEARLLAREYLVLSLGLADKAAWRCSDSNSSN